ncbi:hypothetical protein GQ53DRAFT_886717 [Thozetella sp. PMI_491]|nr:hypothetical protein GQ53DRAFT_886717 [Thozetella sp. PMI_491]
MAQVIVPLEAVPNREGVYLDPCRDVSGWWSALMLPNWTWRWFDRPHLFFKPNLEYVSHGDIEVVDGLGRTKTYKKAFECYLDPVTGKIKTLYVQATESICALSGTDPNCTWKRTCIRNVSPIPLRVANLPFRFVPEERRHDISKYTVEDWLIVVGMWIPTMICFLLAFFTWESGPPEGKPQDKYWPLLYSGLRYPRLARNLLENRQEVVEKVAYHPAWNPKAMGSYRTFRPRFLNYLVPTVIDGKRTYKAERGPVTQDSIVPYVVVAYSSAHFNLQRSPEATGENQDLVELLGIATQAATHYFKSTSTNLETERRAFWIAANCLPPDQIVDDSGEVKRISIGTPEAVDLANQDVSSTKFILLSISDIIRAAKHVIIVAGNRRRAWDQNALRVWGNRVWTLPEVVLSQGDQVMVVHCGKRDGDKPVEILHIPKTVFPSLAWDDALISRQLIEHYSNLRLSRLELVKITLDCLMSRKFRALRPGDRAYVLMGLLRIRPPIDNTDSSFQAFARLSLPQDSDRLMERLICLLPETPDQDWELMTDRYKASLWDIYPETQVCGIGENDTVIVDGAKAAQIQWDGFTKVRTLRKTTMKRWIFLKMVVWSPLLFIIGAVLLGIFPAPVTLDYYPTSYRYGPSSISVAYGASGYYAGLSIFLLTLFLFVVPAPYYLWNVYGGKLRQVEPCFFGIEGYVPLEAIEAKLFGMHSNRMRWSAAGSPLSRHRQGKAIQERTWTYAPAQNDDVEPLLQATVEGISTYSVEPIDPCSPCPKCIGTMSILCDLHPTPVSCRQQSRSRMGEMKVFTLVDTFNMTATLFYAIRPPTVLIMGGREGGMKRAIACSFDISTGTLYRETVLRIPSQSADCMESIPRVRLGLKRPYFESDVRRV